MSATCTRLDRRIKCATRAKWEESREMRWDGWHGYVFPVTCGEYVKPMHGLVWHFCPACGGDLPLGLRPLILAAKPHTQADGEGEE